jgi:hypothetical protein
MTGAARQRQHVMAQAKESGHRRKALTGVGALHSLRHQIPLLRFNLYIFQKGALSRCTKGLVNCGRSARSSMDRFLLFSFVIIEF